MNLNRSKTAVTLALCLLTQRIYALGPYSPDTNTTFLYHFDEAAGTSSAANEGTSGYAAISFDGAWPGDNADMATITTSLGATSFAGFGNAATLTNSTGFGVDLSGDGGFRTNDATPISPDRFPDHTEILGSSFTLEAMINVSTISIAVPQEIISTDSFATVGNAGRGFQFRIIQGNLEFYFIGSATGVASATIPTSGTNAFVADEWFHVAVSFDGTTLNFYWTRVDATATSANLIGTAAHSIDLTDSGPLVLGNEGRVSGSSPAIGTVISNEGLQGLLDEVRISNIARAPTEFIFSSSGETNPAFTNISRTQDGSQVTFTWRSRPSATYFIEFSPDLKTWFEIDDSFDSEGTTSSFTDTVYTELFPFRGAYRVREN